LKRYLFIKTRYAEWSGKNHFAAIKILKQMVVEPIIRLVECGFQMLRRIWLQFTWILDLKTILLWLQNLHWILTTLSQTTNSVKIKSANWKDGLKMVSIKRKKTGERSDEFDLLILITL
jgi:hypothetical protein